MLRGASSSWPLVLLAVACSGGTNASDATPSAGASSASGAAGAGAGGKQGAGGASGTGAGAHTGGASGAAGQGGAPASGGRGGGSANGGAAGTTSTGGSVSGGTSGAGGYTTDFDLTESPLSEKGAWHHAGLDWTTASSGSGIAFGTQALGVNRSGPTQYDDSYAYLAGFPPDQQASAVIHLGTIDPSCTHEVEILLRWSDSAHSAQGYECNVAFDGSYAQIVRWNGAVGDYTYLDQNGSVPGGVHDADTVSAVIAGSKITLSVNGTVRAIAQDATYASGNPGVGFWRGSTGCGAFEDYGFTHFEAK